MSAVLLERPKVLDLSPPEMSPEAFATIPDGDRYELIDGKLVDRNMGAKASQIGENVLFLIGGFTRKGKKGKLFGPNCGYQIFSENPSKVRFPDGSFILRDRLPENKTPDGFIRIPPDWALEVVSPNDTAEEVEIRRVDLLRAGIKLLWVIYPENRTVHLFRSNGAPTILTEVDEIAGEDVLPGFSCRVAEFFEDT